MPRCRPLAFCAALGAALGPALAGCTSSGDGAPSTAAASTTTSTTIPEETDRRLTIGLLLPRPGDSPLGEGVSTAAREAAVLVNERGGVLGKKIRIIPANEGSNLADTQRSFERLRTSGVDAVVGPTSSLAVLGLLETMVDAGVVTCSPTASALRLDEFPDNGLFFRTVPSDSLQAVAIADEAEGTGARNAAVAYFDDAYGRGLAEAVTAELDANGIPVEETAISPADDDLRSEAAAVLDGETEVAIVLGDNVGGPRILAAMGNVLRRDADRMVPDVVVNDAIRRPESPDLIAELPVGLQAAIHGVAPTALAALGSEPLGVFATNAYDCVTAIALAAEEAESDRPSDIAAQMQPISSAGSTCRGWEPCKELIDAGRNIDYDGPGGALDLGEDGDPTRSRFDQFTFTPDGREEDDDNPPIVVSRI